MTFVPSWFETELAKHPEQVERMRIFVPSVHIDEYFSFHLETDRRYIVFRHEKLDSKYKLTNNLSELRSNDIFFCLLTSLLPGHRSGFQSTDLEFLKLLKKDGLVDFRIIDSQSDSVPVIKRERTESIPIADLMFEGQQSDNWGQYGMFNDAEIYSLGCTRLPFKRNHCFVLYGSSGCGKSTMIKYLSSYMMNVEQAFKVTTRENRSSDDGALVVSEDEFLKLQKNNLLVACYSAFGNRYAYLKESIDSLISKGKDVLLDTTSLSAAMMLRDHYGHYARLVYVDSSFEHSSSSVLRRYSEMPRIEMNALSNAALMRIRLNEIERRYVHISDMKEQADFILSFEPIIVRQKLLRNYILSQRFSGAIILPSNPP